MDKNPSPDFSAEFVKAARAELERRGENWRDQNAVMKARGELAFDETIVAGTGTKYESMPTHKLMLIASSRLEGDPPIPLELSKPKPTTERLVGPNWETFYDEYLITPDGENTTLCLWRAKVPGGWMVYAVEKKEDFAKDRVSSRPAGLTFIPDPSHGWTGSSPF